MPERATSPENPAHGHEKTDMNVRQILWFFLLLTASILIVLGLMVGMFFGLEKTRDLGEAISPLAPPRFVPPDPKLQVVPQMELNALRESERKILGEYGKAEQQALDPEAAEKGIEAVRIPIDRAMDLVAERGLPSRKEAQPYIQRGYAGQSNQPGITDAGGVAVGTAQDRIQRWPVSMAPVAPATGASGHDAGGDRSK
ncbi:MAG: hypothetical protein ACRD7E_26365 [Bryobacteraceae bacterium]